MKISIITSAELEPLVNKVHTNIDNFDIRKLFAIIDQTRGVILYATGTPGKGYIGLEDNIIELEQDITSFDSRDVIQIIYEDDYDRQLLETLLYFITSLVEKMPRVDAQDRQVVNIETGSVGVTSLPVLNTLINMQNFSGGNTVFIPQHMAQIGATHLYDKIIIS